jgi:hypothetical protein
MAKHPERIEQLVEQSSFGDADARRARTQVSDTTARAVPHPVTTAPATGSYSTRTATSSRATRSAVTGQFRSARGTHES